MINGSDGCWHNVQEEFIRIKQSGFSIGYRETKCVDQPTRDAERACHVACDVSYGITGGSEAKHNAVRISDRWLAADLTQLGLVIVGDLLLT